MLLVILVAIGKEIFDAFTGGVVDILDIMATIAGGIVSWLLFLI